MGTPTSNAAPDREGQCETPPEAAFEASTTIPLQYATPVRPIDRWQGWPLASGALYAVITGIWAFLWIPYGIGYYELPWHNRAFRIAMMLWAPAHMLAAIPLIRRAQKHRRPIWLESISFAVSIWCLLAMIGWMETGGR